MQDDLWARWQRWLDDDSYWPPHSALVHGDLYPRHVLVDGDSRITGVLDWTEAKVTDPAIDFTGHLLVFGEEALDRLISEYERLGGRVWPRMRDHVRERLAMSPASYALYALRAGLDDHLEAARVQLGVKEA